MQKNRKLHALGAGTYTRRDSPPYSNYAENQQHSITVIVPIGAAGDPQNLEADAASFLNILNILRLAMESQFA